MTDIIKHSYNGAIVSQEYDGYVSLTDMAKASGKKVNDYLRLASSKAYFEGLSGSTGITVDKLIRVNESSGRNENRGTWAHPEIAIDFAQWCSVPFRIWANSVLRGVITQVKPEPKKAITYYSDRVADIRKNLVKPKGHWCVIEKCNHLLLEVEKAGYPIDQFDLLDGSIGKRWANYRKELGLPAPKEEAFYKIPHCSTPVFVACYPSSELGIFSDWLEGIYEQKYLNKYLQGKYGKLAKVS
jgi:hypothetical protein